jgi:hypothetical protein
LNLKGKTTRYQLELLPLLGKRVSVTFSDRHIFFINSEGSQMSNKITETAHKIIDKETGEEEITVTRTKKETLAMTI